jgi:hypothetical protein
LRQGRRAKLPLAVVVLTSVALASCSSTGSVTSGSAIASPDIRYATTVTSSGPVNPAAIPLGDGYVSTLPKVGYVDSCTKSFPAIGGATVVGPWINETKKTWDSSLSRTLLK